MLVKILRALMAELRERKGDDDVNTGRCDRG
jgi:hypothetical protein